MSAQPDPWQVITDVTSALLLGGQTAAIRCTTALRVLDAAGIDFSGNPVKAAAAHPAPATCNVHVVGAGGYNGALALVCTTEGKSGAECDAQVWEVEPGDTWDEIGARIAAHNRKHHPAATAAEPAPGHLAVMRGTIALRDAEIELLQARVAELAEALGEAAGHVEPADQNSELAVDRWLELAKRYRAPRPENDPGGDG